jgi:hypothetical protein
MAAWCGIVMDTAASPDTGIFECSHAGLTKWLNNP